MAWSPGRGCAVGRSGGVLVRAGARGRRPCGRRRALQVLRRVAAPQRRASLRALAPAFQPGGQSHAPSAARHRAPG
jgi:hypothetical protein